MKIITLNTWGGRAGKERLLSFFENNKDVDIFCLQEIWSAPYNHLEGHSAGGKNIEHEEIMTYGLQEISALMSDYIPYFRPHHLDNYGLMMLVKKNLQVKEEGEVFVYKHKGFVPVGDVGFHARNVQYITIADQNKPLTIMNFHGLWTGTGKYDTEDRIQQSKNIIEFTKKLEGNYTLCGDFNLLPETESINILENAGLRNLVSEYDITSTRTSFYTKPDKFADYIFTTPGITVKDFKVLPDEVSDHAALYVEII
jgi:endonuclease/exonuclease/phosphatase family metal-dependent hydrolase